MVKLKIVVSMSFSFYSVVRPDLQSVLLFFYFLLSFLASVLLEKEKLLRAMAPSSLVQYELRHHV